MWTILSENSDSSATLALWPPPSAVEQDGDCGTFNIPVLKSDGELGTPLPFSMRNDNLFTITLLLCFVVFIVSLSRSTYLLTHQAKTFFQSSYKADSDMPSAYPVFHVIMVVITSILLSFASYIFVTEGFTSDFVVESQYLVVIIFFACFLVYFFVKWIAYSLVNTVFFGSKKRLQWNYSYLFIISFTGILMFPLVFLMVYFNMSIENAVFYIISILVLNKILTFYKCWSIFFRQNVFFLQIFLYFCALEATPLLVFGGAWLAVVNLLKVNI